MGDSSKAWHVVIINISLTQLVTCELLYEGFHRESLKSYINLIHFLKKSPKVVAIPSCGRKFHKLIMHCFRAESQKTGSGTINSALLAASNWVAERDFCTCIIINNKLNLYPTFHLQEVRLSWLELVLPTTVI